MCGNRLKLWNTMPTSRRSAVDIDARPLTPSPSRRISPPSIGSSPLMQRSSVDLPHPEAPIRQTTSCSLDGQVDAVEHLVIAEALVDPPQLEEAGVLGAGSDAGVELPSLSQPRPVTRSDTQALLVAPKR